MEAAAYEPKQCADESLIVLVAQPLDAAAKALTTAFELAEPAMPIRDPRERRSMLRRQTTVRSLADALQVREVGDCLVDVALQAVQVHELIEQYELSRIVKTATAPQVVHCALQLFDRRSLLHAPRGFAQRERTEQRVCK